MAKYIPLDALVAEINKLVDLRKFKTDYDSGYRNGGNAALNNLKERINSLEVKEVGVWKTVDNMNLPQADKNKIYCVFTKDRYILAKVIYNPKDEELLQWKCTEFPYNRYDMCEGDKYMQIV